MPVASGVGVELAYEESGDGPAVLLVHGLAATGADWAADRSRLAAAGARAIAYDRRGYGGSTAPEPYERTTVQEQAEDAATLLEALGAAPVLVAGADLGALVALDLVARHRRLVAGAVLLAPPLYPLVPDAAESLAQERLALEGALRDGGPAAAVAAWLGGRGGAARAERAARDASAFFADYAGLATWPVARRDLRALDAPLVVLDDERALPRDVVAADALAALLPAAARVHGPPDPVGALLSLMRRSGRPAQEGGGSTS